MNPQTNNERQPGNPAKGPVVGGSYAHLLYRKRGEAPVRKNIWRLTTLIGSADGCNIQLVSSKIAPAHCVITADDGVLRVRAFRSKIGIRVNGKPVEVAPLQNGDKLEIGKFIFRVETDLRPTVADSEATQIELPVSTASDQGPDAAPQAGSTSKPSHGSPGNGRSQPASRPDTAAPRDGKRSSPSTQAAARPQIEFEPFQIDEFQVDQILGSGGMGWIYGATDLRTGERVAIKAIATTRDQGLLSRFEVEAKAGMRTRHRNVVHTREYHRSVSVHFAVLDYVEGIGLNELVEMYGRLDYRLACNLGEQLAMGLQHLHEVGLIHRDVKPANILVTATGDAKLLDFGLTLVRDDEDEFSLAMIFGHDCLGTADFMAPEQSRDSFAVDERADVYSLGSTLYAAMSGTVAFPYKTVPQKLDALRTKEPRSLRSLVPAVPEEVAAVIHKMMAKRPEDRYPTARDAAQALRTFAKQQPVAFDFDAVLYRRYRIARLRMEGNPADSGALARMGRRIPSISQDSDRQAPPESFGTEPQLSAAAALAVMNSVETLHERVIELAESEPDFADLIANWDALPEETKRQITAQVRASREL